MEFQRWAPQINYIAYKGAPNARKNLQVILRTGNFQVVLTTYEYIIKDRPALSKFLWQHMSNFGLNPVSIHILMRNLQLLTKVTA